MVTFKVFGKDMYSGNIPIQQSIKEQTQIRRKIVGVCNYFFSQFEGKRLLPFRGFLIYGPPGTGKTELVKRAAYELDEDFQSKNLGKIQLMLVDGGDIAAPKWGEGEKKLRDIFEEARKDSDVRTIILFDDIETFILGRDAGLAKEWHFSLNSIFFHELDTLDLTKIMVIGTTNRNDLVDEALRSRLYSFQLGLPSIKDLMKIAEKFAAVYDISDFHLKDIELKLNKSKNPSIRTVEHYITDVIISKF